MASLSHLSDTELRKKLKEYGINSPVTLTTRDILLKKLNHFMISDKKALKSKPTFSHEASQTKSTDRRTSKINSQTLSTYKGISSSLSTFSSDEEEEEEFPSTTRLRRSSRNSSTLSSNSTHNKSQKSQREERSKPSSTLKNSFSTKANQEEASHQTPVNFGKKRTSYYSNKSITRYGNGNQYDTCSDSDDVDESGPSLSNDTTSKQKVSTPIEPYTYRNFRTFDERLDVKRRTNSNFFPEASTSNYRGLDRKYSLNSTRNSFDNSLLEIKSPDDVVSHETMNLSLANGQSPLDQSSKSSDQSFDGSVWLQSVPLLLIILFILFFGFLGLCYMNIHSPLLASLQVPSWLFSVYPFRSNDVGHPKEIAPDSEVDLPLPILKREPILRTFDLGKLKLQICEEDSKFDCLSRSEVESVPDIIHLMEGTIMPALIEQSGSYQCGTSPNPYLGLAELKILVLKNLYHKEEIEIQNGLMGLAKLVTVNSDFGVEAFWQAERSKDNLPELLGLATTVQPTEILCHVTSAFYSLIYFVVALLLVAMTAWMAVLIIRYYKRQGEEQEQKSFELVEQILEVLESSCGVSGKEFIAVNHVRDCLIPPRERKAKSSIWNRAVKFIDDHDSRVYREIRNVGGEDCEVWRWVSGAPRSPISCPPKSALIPDNSSAQEKIWQGQAFESLEITQNLPQVSPTSCLKIRNMFDSEIEFGEDWPRRIQDSILEKCESIPIVHIAVDRASKEGCVYLKCVTAKAAGEAFRALHGWWFDGHLVTVKYLRDERYHERFPTARLTTTPLVPSNNERLSLQHSLSTILPPTPTSSTPNRHNFSRGYYGKL